MPKHRAHGPFSRSVVLGSSTAGSSNGLKNTPDGTDVIADVWALLKDGFLQLRCFNQHIGEGVVPWRHPGAHHSDLLVAPSHRGPPVLFDRPATTEPRGASAWREHARSATVQSQALDPEAQCLRAFELLRCARRPGKGGRLVARSRR